MDRRSVRSRGVGRDRYCVAITATVTFVGIREDRANMFNYFDKADQVLRIRVTREVSIAGAAPEMVLFMKRTAQGRVATPLAYRHFGIDPPTTTGQTRFF